jgi:hypothetical protein
VGLASFSRKKVVVSSLCVARLYYTLTLYVPTCLVILEYLLDENKKAVLKENPKYKHIRSMKDLTNCIFTPNPEFPAEGEAPKAAVRADASQTEKSKFICPITLIEMNGRYPQHSKPKVLCDDV